MNTKTAAERIDALRRTRGINVSAFSKLIGISRQAYYDRLNGITSAWPEADMMKAAELLETNTRALRYGPESAFTSDDKVQLERCLELLVARLERRGISVADVPVTTLARMLSHCYGMASRGASLDETVIDGILDLADVTTKQP